MHKVKPKAIAGICCNRWQQRPVCSAYAYKKARPNQVALCGANPGQERAV